MDTDILLVSTVIHAFYLTKAHPHSEGNGPSCSDKSVAYWSGKFYNKYSGDDEPEIRCDKENGYCMREGEGCVSKDWVRWQTSCYDTCYCCFNKAREESALHDWYLHEDRATWQEAKAFCQAKGGSLLIPHNIADVIEFMQGNKIGTHDVWVGIKDFLGKYEGIDGNYIHNGWQSGQPRGTEKQGENCVVLEDDRGNKPGMKVEPCCAENYFICNFVKDYRKGHNVFIDDMYNMNEIDLDRFGLEKYSGVYGKTIIIEEFRRSWQEAREHCQDLGGDLLVPPKISNLVQYIRDLKLGEHDIWVGYSASANRASFTGINGNTILGGWQDGEPRGPHGASAAASGDETCVAVEDDDVHGAGLKVQPCRELHLYACDISINQRGTHDTQF